MDFFYFYFGAFLFACFVCLFCLVFPSDAFHHIILNNSQDSSFQSLVNYIGSISCELICCGWSLSVDIWSRISCFLFLTVFTGFEKWNSVEWIKAVFLKGLQCFESDDGVSETILFQLARNVRQNIWCYRYTIYHVAVLDKTCDQMCWFFVLFSAIGNLLKQLSEVFPWAKLSWNLESWIHFRVSLHALAGLSSPLYLIHFGSIIIGLISAR